jgi:hypothetical protein
MASGRLGVGKTKAERCDKQMGETAGENKRGRGHIYIIARTQPCHPLPRPRRNFSYPEHVAC